MNNKQVGLIITSFAVILGIVIYFFNRALTQIVNTSCDHGATCPMWGSIKFHTNITIALMIIVLLIGLYFVFFSDREKRKQKKDTKKYEIPKNLNPEEKQIIQIIIEEDGAIFQSHLTEKTEFSKVKITRILDKLEGRGIIERKRRGMTNVVILKQ
jgi:uncharacterized membrane protein